MRRRLRVGVGAIAAALAAACAGPSAGGGSGGPGQPGTPIDLDRPTAGPGAGAVSPTAEGEPALPPIALPNGISAVLLPADARTGMAEIVLGIVAGSDTDRPGLAELAAEALLEGTDASAGRASLRASIERLGGTIGFEVGPLSTWFAIRVPGPRWATAQQAVTDALMAQPMSRHQLERVRDGLLQRRTLALWNDPATWAVRSFLLGNASPADTLAALLDRDPSEVLLFLARHYRPDSAVLGLRVPADLPQVATALGSGLGRWRAAAPPAAAAAPNRSSGLREGLYWAAGPVGAGCRVMLVVPLPEPTQRDAAVTYLLTSCLTLDGIGGRLERQLQAKGLADLRWQVRRVPAGERSAMVLTTEALPEQVPGLWEAALAARRSLQEQLPQAAELAVARRRLALMAHADEVDPVRRLRATTLRRLRALPDDLLERDLATFAPATDLAAAVQRFAQQPLAMIVVGGSPTPTTTLAQPFELVPLASLPKLTGAPLPTLTTAATPWLDGAIDAVGSRALLRQLDGCRAKRTLRTVGAPEIDEEVAWRRGGHLRRKRSVLQQTIETSIAPGAWVEQLGSERLQLSAQEAGYCLRQVERHPLLLLAAQARGELDFRAIAQRRVGDRDMMILEAADGRFDRLRVHIDTESMLIRVVETWEAGPDGTPVYVHDAWSDYRSVDGLRAPFRCLVELDDGQARHEVVYREFEPRFAAR